MEMVSMLVFGGVISYPNIPLLRHWDMLASTSFTVQQGSTVSPSIFTNKGTNTYPHGWSSQFGKSYVLGFLLRGSWADLARAECLTPERETRCVHFSEVVKGVKSDGRHLYNMYSNMEFTIVGLWIHWIIEESNMREISVMLFWWFVDLWTWNVIIIFPLQIPKGQNSTLDSTRKRMKDNLTRIKFLTRKLCPFP